MTLKELLDRCDFKDIVPCIVKCYPEEAVNMSCLKEAFDTLRHLTPKLNPDYESGQEITICPVYYDEDEKKFYKEDYYIDVHPCGDYWESSLAKDIVVSEELTLTDNEIAAHCLWEMTFYGNPYNVEEHEKVCLKLHGKTDASNPYTVAAEKLEDRLRKNYLPKQYKFAENYSSCPARLEGKNGKPTPYFKEIPMDLMWREPCKNRPKRMRDHRLNKRIEALERMAKVEDTIRCFTRNTKSFTREELEYLFKTNLIYQNRYHTFAFNVNQRLDYLIDLLINYVSEDYSRYTHFLLMFRTASAYPLIQKELDMIQHFFSQYLPASANIRYGYGNDENLNTEISLLLLGSYYKSVDDKLKSKPEKPKKD